VARPRSLSASSNLWAPAPQKVKWSVTERFLPVRGGLGEGKQSPGVRIQGAGRASVPGGRGGHGFRGMGRAMAPGGAGAGIGPGGRALVPGSGAGIVPAGRESGGGH